VVGLNEREVAMPNLRTIVGVSLCVSMLGILGNAEAQISRPLDPKAAEQYASDSEKAEGGDPEAAYRIGQALESGRLGGVVDLSKALMFYRKAAEQGHRQAADRVGEIETKLGRNEEKLQAAPPSPGQ
jgi:TPR repeat protein